MRRKKMKTTEQSLRGLIEFLSDINELQEHYGNERETYMVVELHEDEIPEWIETLKAITPEAE